MDKRVSGSGMRFYLKSEYKGDIGKLLKKLKQKGYRVLVSDTSNGKKALYGLSLLENSTGKFYKIKLQDAFTEFDINKKNKYEADLINKRDTQTNRLLSDLFNLILKATNKEVFYDRIQNYLNSKKFQVEFCKKITESVDTR